MEYRLARSNRKSVGIQITPEGVLEVRAPLRLSKADIDQLVDGKRDWIQKHMREIKDRQAQKAAFSLMEGDSLPLMGQSYPVRYGMGQAVRFDGQAFVIPREDFEALRPGMIRLYRKIGEKLLPQRVDQYAAHMGRAPVRVGMSNAAKRWGSCSGRGSIRFSWMLMMADSEAVDYVVVHELAHLWEMNHSPRFWKRVGEILPDYKAREARLKQLHRKLAAEGWI